MPCFSEKTFCYQYSQKIEVFCCHGIENIVRHLKILKSVWAKSISQKNYWLVARMILHFIFSQLKLFFPKTFFVPLPISKTLTASTIVGNFTCLEVVFKFKRRLGWVGGAKDFSDCTHFSFQVLSVSHLCSHLLDRHHVLDIILDQARGESFEHTH